MTDLLTHLRTWGLDVDDDDIVRGHAGTFKPRGVLCHHTASPSNSGEFGSLRVVTAGRPDLSGPLCNLLLGRYGKVKIITLGVGYHAGYGGPYQGIPKDQGNSYLYGIEAENNGLGEPWTSNYDEYVTLCAALLAYMGTKDVEKVFAHKEWAPGRKTDPAGIIMDDFREDVRDRLKKGPSKNVIKASNLKRGKFNKDVVRLKRRLARKGAFKGSPTPFYGKNIDKAYTKFAKQVGPGKNPLEELGFIVLP